VIQVRNVEKRRGSTILWGGLSFSVRPGEVVAVTGPSGAGKSTLLDCVGHIDTVDSGSVVIDGRDAGRSARRARLVRRDVLGYLFQDFGLVPDLTVAANVDLARNRHGAVASDGPTTAAALAAVGLDGRGTERTHRLSGGEQQRAAVARLLVRRPKVVLADEPTSALDDENAALVLDHLERLARGGTAVLIATHASAVVARATRTVELAAPTTAQTRR